MKTYRLLAYLIIILTFSACIPTPVGGGGVGPVLCNCNIDSFLIDKGTYYIPKDGITEIRGLTLHKPLHIYNNANVNSLKYTNLVVRDCLFENIDSTEAITLIRVNGIKFIHCSIRNIVHSDGILISNSNNVTLENCTIKLVDFCGINTAEDPADANFLVGGAFNLTIRNCLIDSVAFQNSDLGPGSNYTHGIYSKGRNVSIENNTFSNIFCPAGGNGISLRNSGIVRNNIVFNTTTSGIGYHSNYFSAGGTALIENNLVYNSNTDGIHVNGFGADCVSQLVVRFNTVIQTNATACVVVNTFPNTSQLYVNGNLLYNPFLADINDIIIPNVLIPTNFHLENNFATITDPGFINAVNHQFGLSNAVTANWSNASNAPSLDILGNTRTFPTDFGAYKY